MHKHPHTHIPTHYTSPVGAVCCLRTRQERRDNREIDKQQCNFTITTKILCRVQESMQETGQRRRRRRDRTERQSRERQKSRRQSREEREREERLEHEKP